MHPASVILRPAVAVIDEERCIGCALCLQACPVDAIVGAAKLMHTVIANACTGCELCIPPCPVDCISMLPIPMPDAKTWIAAEDAARRRVEARNARLLRDDKAARAAAQREASAERRKRETIAKALARARTRLENR